MSIKRPIPFLSKWGEQSLLDGMSKQEKDKTVIVPPDNGADHSKGRADFQTGFPRQTMISVLNGGVPPWGQDHNGVLYRLSEANQWTQAGGLPIFDQALCDKIGGYPIGAELQSTRYLYVSYINMVEGNTNNPDDGTKIEDYWNNNSNRGNGWAIKTILSDDSDSISYLDNNCRIVTKVAGNKNILFVRPNFDGVNLLIEEGSDKPYLNVQAAINAIPDGGTAAIHIYFPDGPYYTTSDNCAEVSKDNCYWNIGNKNITLLQYGNNMLDIIGNEISSANLPYNKYVYKDYERLVIKMPAYKNGSYCMTSGIVGTGSLDISGMEFIVCGNRVDGEYNGAFLSPHITLTVTGCSFSGIGIYPAIWGGWGGHTTVVKLVQCYFRGDGQFFWLSDDILSLTVVEQTEKSDGLDREPFKSNSKDYLGKSSHYLLFGLVQTGFTNDKGNGKIYTPRGLNTYLPITVDS